MAQNSTTFPASPETRNIIILGGSYAGISTAHYVLKHVIPKLSSSYSYQVVLISASSQAMCRPACPRALISDSMFTQSKLFVNILPLFSQYPPSNFRFVHGTATALNHTARTVSISLDSTVENTNLAFHALVLATGASTPSPLLGLNTRDATSLRASWATFRTALPSAKSIIISGGGPAGIETAGELGEFLNGRNNSAAKVSITVIHSGANILQILRPSLALKAETYLKQVGVTVLKNTQVKSVGPVATLDNENTDGSSDNTWTKPAVVTLSNGQTLHCDIYIPATGTTPNVSFISPALLAKDGRVETNSSTLRVDIAGKDARIYALGDVSNAARPAVHMVLAEVPVLCANLKRDLLLAEAEERGDDKGAVGGEDRKFEEDRRETQLVPIGKSKGVGAAMGWALPSSMVWLIKGRDYWLWTTEALWSGKQWAKES